MGLVLRLEKDETAMADCWFFRWCSLVVFRRAVMVVAIVLVQMVAGSGGGR